jgi:hypothetical protein
MDKRDKIVAEILSTESSYIADLQVCCSCFVAPLRTYLAELASAEEQRVINGEDSDRASAAAIKAAQIEHSNIFSNIEQLLDFNKVFHADLSTSFDTHKGNNIGRIFKEAAPFFKMYTTYVSNYERAEGTLKQWLTAKSPVGLASFIRAVELQQPCHGLRLMSFLIMPVQRIPRYKMLLVELLKVTPEHHPDYHTIKQALDIISSVATALNNDIKNFEVRKRTIEVATQFETFELLTPSRMFVKQGVLKKVCRSAKKDFTFVLFNDLLIYGSPKLTSTPTGDKFHKLHREISLHNSYVVDGITNFMEGFLLINSKKSFYIDCGSAVVKNEWVDAIREQNEQLNAKIQQKSSWRSKYTTWENEISVWGMDDDKDASSDPLREVWGLNGPAMSQGRGMLTIIPAADIRKIGEPGIALLSRSDDYDRASRGSISMMGDAVRRMSQKFNSFKGKAGESERDSMGTDSGRSSVSPPPPPQANLHENQHRAIQSSVSRQSANSPTVVEMPAEPEIAVGPVEIPDTPFNQLLFKSSSRSSTPGGGGGSSRPHSMSVQVNSAASPAAPATRPQSMSVTAAGGGAGNVGLSRAFTASMSGEPHALNRRSSAGVSHNPAARFANRYTTDSAIMYTGEFPATIGAYGLGLELTNSTSPFKDHPSPSIVRVASFTSLPNGAISPGKAAGLEVGDFLVAIDGVGVPLVHQIEELLGGLNLTKGSSVSLRIRRGGGAAVQSNTPTGARQAPSARASYAAANTRVNFDAPGGGGGGGRGGGGGGGGGSEDLLGLETVQGQPQQPAKPTRRFTLNHDNRESSVSGLPDHHLLSSRAGGGAWSSQGQEAAGESLRDSDFDVMNLMEIDFLNLMGMTKHKFRSMSEAERKKKKESLGL